MKRSASIIVFLLLTMMAALLGVVASQVYRYVTKPEFSPVPDQIVETIPDPGIPDVTGRKKGLVQLSSSSMFKNDKERKEWLNKWSHDKETKDWVKDGPTSPLFPQQRSVEEAFGTHRIVPTIGGAEDEAPFYPSTPIEYAYIPPSYPSEYWYGGGSRITVTPTNDCDCDCLCCDCRPCGGPEDVAVTTNTVKPPIKPHVITPPVIPPINPPIEPPIDPPKVPEASTILMLVIGLAVVWNIKHN